MFSVEFENYTTTSWYLLIEQNALYANYKQWNLMCGKVILTIEKDHYLLSYVMYNIYVFAGEEKIQFRLIFKVFDWFIYVFFFLNLK